MSSHWESTYARTTPEGRSWSEDSAKTSLAWIAGASGAKNAAVVDVGGGASHLVDELLSVGYTNVTVVDLSASALAEVKARVGGRATLIEGDLFEWTPQAPLGLWHDRAVLHFLVSDDQRSRYVDHVAESVAIGGAVIVASFSLNGPEQCSGLPVSRASAEDLRQLFGPRFALQEEATINHETPWGSTQSFTWVRFSRLDEQLDAEGESARVRTAQGVSMPTR
jgi:hypothetical protein